MIWLRKPNLVFLHIRCIPHAASFDLCPWISGKVAYCFMHYLLKNCKGKKYSQTQNCFKFEVSISDFHVRHVFLIQSAFVYLPGMRSWDRATLVQKKEIVQPWFQCDLKEFSAHYISLLLNHSCTLKVRPGIAVAHTWNSFEGSITKCSL